MHVNKTEPKESKLNLKSKNLFQLMLHAATRMNRQPAGSCLYRIIFQHSIPYSVQKGNKGIPPVLETGVLPES